MLIETTHQDIVHDIAFNYSGNRFATASSDQSIRVYDKIDGKWEKTAEQKCHDGPIWKIRWADPKFGQLIATCSHDKGVCVWEEKKFYQEDRKIITQWRQRIIIIESKDAVADIQFGSKNNGLLLAIAYIDGKLQLHRVYEQNQFIKEGEDVLMMPYGLKSISWNHAPLEKDMLVVGGNAFIDRYISTPKEEIPNCKTLSIWMLQQGDRMGMQKIFEFDEYNTVQDVQWANQNGRSFHLIAAAGKEGVIIWQIKINDNSQVTLQKQIRLEEKLTYQAYRVSWNILANLIAVSCITLQYDDNKQNQTNKEVRVFQNVNGNWVFKAIVNESDIQLFKQLS